MFVLSEWKQRTADARAFCEKYDTEAERVGLDPNLPELRAVKARAWKIVRSVGAESRYLARLDPKGFSKHSSDGTLYAEDTYGRFGYVLRLSTIAKWYSPDISDKLSRIVVDLYGAHLYTKAGLLMTFDACNINPRREVRDDRPYQRACRLIEGLTKVHLDWRTHAGRTKRIMLVKKSAATWEVDVSEDHSTAI